MNETLQEGWSTASLSEVTEMIRGVTYKKVDSLNIEQDGYLPILRANNIQNGILYFNDLVYVPKDKVSSKQKIQEGDVVIAMSSGSKKLVGKSARAKKPWNGGFGAFCGILRPHKQLCNRFISWFTYSKEYRNKVSELSAGVNINNLKPIHFNEIFLPIAPLAEQKEIATLLDNLLAQVDTLKNRLDTLPILLKRFRQSVLAAAVSGKLTEDWRKHNLSLKVQSLNEIEQHWKLQYEKNDKKYRRPNIVAIEASNNSLLPATWLKTQIGYVFDVYIGSTPKRSNKAFWRGSINWVSSSEVSFCTIKNTKEGITDLGLKSASTRVHPVGTVMLAMIGQGKTRGQAAILGVEACHNQNTSALRIPSKYAESKFLYYYLVKQYEETRQVGGGNNQKALNKSTVMSLRFPFPPLIEQTEIVTRVETLFAFANKIEQRLKQAQEQTNKLTPSLLAKAFRGDLTADWRKQNPALITGENSAEALLARIKAEQEKLKPKRKTRQKKT